MEPEQEYDRRSSSNSKIHYLHSADKKSPKTKKNSVKKSSELSRQEARGSGLSTVNDFVKNVNDVVEKQHNIEKEFFTIE